MAYLTTESPYSNEQFWAIFIHAFQPDTATSFAFQVTIEFSVYTECVTAAYIHLSHFKSITFCGSLYDVSNYTKQRSRTADELRRI
jgi:hypothetical protein